MSEDLINQLTLNFLVGKAQLSKLNKKMKDSQEELTKLNDKEIYRKRIEELFNNLYNNNKPSDLLQDVETGFNFFLEKAIYYLKIHDKHLELNENINAKDGSENMDSLEEDSSDADDYYNDDKDDYYSEENSDVGNASEDEESKEAVNKQFEMIQTVEKKLKKNTFLSPGFDNINDINCNWFESAKQNIKKDAIIPRTNNNLDEPNNISEKKKNIAIIYETTNKKKQK